MDRFRAFAIVCSGGDVRNMRPQVFNDLIRVLELLGGEVAVIEYPVILFPVFMLAAQDVHGRV